MHSSSALTIAVVVLILTSITGSATAQTTSVCKLFQERGGLLVMEAESVGLAGSWSLRNEISRSLGEGYIEWKHGDQNQGIDGAGQGILTYTFNIATEGSYRLLLRSAAPDFTEHNDVWARFPRNAATGLREEGRGSISIEPNTWFKVYQNAGNNAWQWDARTVDNDPHEIYLIFQEPGTYTIELSGRSTLYKIDRLVLFHGQVGYEEATSLNNDESVCTERETTRLRRPDGPGGTLPGMQYAYYEGSWTTLPDFEALDAVDFGITKGFDISPHQREDYFGFLFTGYVLAPLDGNYTFYTFSDDGSQLFIGDEMVVDNDGIHPTQERSGTIGLAAGLHAITVIYFEDIGGQTLNVSWSPPPGGDQQTLGEGNLFYDPDDLLPVELVHFDGVVDQGTVVLNWETASELNNAGFEIERRYDTASTGAVSASTYTTIAFVEGHGTTNTSQRYTYTDGTVPASASTVHYRLKQIDFDGAFAYSEIASISMPAPSSLALHPNYPEPFNPTTTLAFDLTTESPVRLSLYDATGRLVEVLIDDVRPAGRTEVAFAAPSNLTSGLYIYRLETPLETRSGTMTLLK